MKALKYVFLIFILLPQISYSLTLRTYAQDYSPKFILKNGTMQGYSIEIINAIEKTDPEIKFTGQETIASIPRIETELLNGEIDVFVSAFKTKERLKKFSFIDIPLHEFQFMMAVRKNDPISVKTYQEIRNLKSDNVILAMLGTKQETFLKEKNLILDAGSSSFEANVNKLLVGRARFLFGTDISFTQLDQSKIRILPTVFQKESQYIMVSKKISPFALEKLMKAVKKLHDEGKFKAIFKKYEIQKV